MSLIKQITCGYCGKKHLIQAFISHSSSDKPLARTIQDYFCQAGIYPFLFKMPISKQKQAASIILKELAKSSIYIFLLGPEVSKYTWTQAWMAFEDGVFIGLRKRRTSSYNRIYKIPSMFLIEDISQSNNAAVPFFDTAILLDFADIKSWSAIKILFGLINPFIPLNSNLLVESNNLRLQNLLNLQQFHCPNKNCNRVYNIHIWMGRRAKRRLGIPNPSRRFSVKCSTCRSSVNIELKKSPTGPPNFYTKTWQPRHTNLPLMHISRLV